jgi:DNA repair exonuclease SbcCD ATPase subunit
MTELQDMLRVQARLHRKQGANALGQLFESAIEEIQLLKKTYNQLFDAFQNCHDELVDANERIAELEKENKRESMELRSRLGSALGRNSEFNSAIENMQQKLAKANERVRKLEEANLELAANVEACCELVDMDMGAAIERLFEIDNTESKALLNKFAIEKKCESVSELNTYFVNRANREGEMLPIYFPDWCNDFREQLRKEQSDD